MARSSRSRRAALIRTRRLVPGAVITVAAGETMGPCWCATRSSEGWSGLEAMSGIPGLVGATPIQNVGAYGAEVSEMISMVRTLDRSTGHLQDFLPDRVRLRVPNVAFQVRSGTLCGAVGDVPAPPWIAVATDPLCRASPGAGRRDRGASSQRRTSAKPCLSCVTRRAWCSRRMIMTLGASGRSSPTRSSVRIRLSRSPLAHRVSVSPMAW